MYSTSRVQSIRNPDLRLEDIVSTIKTININYSERSLVPKMIREPYRQSRDRGCETKMNGRKAAMATVIIYLNCKRSRNKKNGCN